MMDIANRRTPSSLLERALVRLAKRRLTPAAPAHRLDLIHDVGLDYRWP